MEGYLNKKGRGEGNFGRRTWKKRWFVLEDQALTYYDDLDMNSGFPAHLKGTIHLAGAVCSVYTHHEKKHTFVIKSEAENDCILQAPDTRLMNLWIQEINKAARGESLIEKPDFPALYELLGLDINDQPDAAEINRAYRKKALRCHPDKGGDMLEFKQLQDAFNRINAKLDEDERLSHFNIFTFECVLMKNPGEVALGLSVREEAETRRILIKEVMDGVTIVRLAPQAGGVILPEDWLVKVRDEDVRGMPLLRVAQKLNDFRVPVNSNVKLTFERRVPKTDADYEQDPQHEQPQQEYYPAEAFQNFATQSTSQYVPTGATHTDMDFDIDETTPEERAAAAAASAANSPSPSAKAPSFVPRPPSQSAAAAPPPPFNGSASHLDPVAYVSAMAENEELRADVDAKDRLLAEQAAAQAQLEAKLQQMSQALRQAQSQERHTQEQLLDSQLRHRMTKEQMQASIQSIADTSKRFVAAQQQQQQQQHATNKSVAEVMLDDTSSIPSKTQRLIERVFRHETWQPTAPTSDASAPSVDVSAAQAAVVTSLLLDVNGTFGGRFAGASSSRTPGGGLTAVLGRFESLLHGSSSSQPAAATNAYPQDDFLMDDFQQPPASSSGFRTTTGKALSFHELQQLFVQPNFITQQTPVGQPQYAPAASNTRPPPVTSSGGEFGDFDDFGMGSPAAPVGAPAYGAPSANGGYGNDFMDDFGGLNISSPTPQQSAGRGYNANNSDNHSLMGSVMSSPSLAGSIGVPRVQIPGSVPRPSIGIGHAPSSNANANVPSYAQPKNVRSSVTSASSAPSAQSPAPAAVGFTSPGLVRRRTQQFLNGGGHGASGEGMDFQ